jgi:hypothetical protein
MPFLRLLWYYLWIAPHVFQVGILFLMIRRRWYSQFPMFFLYTGFEILQFAVLFTISISHLYFGGGYLRVYAVGLTLSTATRFGVIHELFGHFFRRYPTLDRPGRFLFRFVILVLLLLAAGLSVSAPGKGTNFLLNATYALDRTVSILQCGLLICLFVFSRYFVLSWRSPAIGIALGVGIFASVELATSAIWLHLGAFGNTTINLLTMATYHCCVLIWIFYLWSPEPKALYSSTGLPVYDLEMWNKELRRLLHQ